MSFLFRSKLYPLQVHPYFKFTPQADRYDVAVIRLNRRVDYAPHISPICLPPKEPAIIMIL